MSAINDGGSAFPQPYGLIVECRGMPLRAYIATAAMQGILANDDMPSDGIQGDVDCAIAYADCMIRTLSTSDGKGEK